MADPVKLGDGHFKALDLRSLDDPAASENTENGLLLGVVERRLRQFNHERPAIHAAVRRIPSSSPTFASNFSSRRAFSTEGTRISISADNAGLKRMREVEL